MFPIYQMLQLYHQYFRPSSQLEQPYSMACINVIAADTDAEANRLATSLYQFAMGIVTNVRRPLPPPVDTMKGIWNEAQEAMIKNMMHYTFIGSKETIAEKLSEFVAKTRVQEIIAVSHIYDHKARIRSYEILSELF